MTGSGFQSNAADVAQAVRGFDESASNVASTMQRMSTELATALSQYRGAQADAFWQLQHHLEADVKVATEQLRTMRSLVHQSHTSYNTGDTEVASSIRGVANSMPDSPFQQRLNP